ncbi:MAG: hypothetical protein NVS4B12_20380 [Ktedonobacteraceae bacterium]
MNTNASNNWLSAITPYTKLLLRWGWFIVLCMVVTTVTTFFLPDPPVLYSYTATLRIQATLPTTADGRVNVNNSTAFYTALFANKITLTPLIQKYKSKYPGATADDILGALQSSVVATPVIDTNFILLSATPTFYVPATAQDAVKLVNDAFNAAVNEIHLRRSKVVDDLTVTLTQESQQAQSAASSTGEDLNQLEQAHQTDTFYYIQKQSIYNAQIQRANSLAKQLQALQQQTLGNADLLKIASSTADLATATTAAPTIGQRYALSPLVGFVMGLGGVLLASMFSARVPLRGKKREVVLPRIIATIPRLSGLRFNQLQTIKDTAPCISLFRHLKYQASEHERSLRLITITSPRGREGKSLVATGLAIAAAQSGMRTVLVDANPQRAILHMWFQAPNTHGILDTVSSPAGASSSPVIQRTFSANLGFVPIGNKQPTSDVLAEALPVNGLSVFISQLHSQADLIIFDGPSLLNDANAANLIQFSDIGILVVDAQKSQSTAVVEAEQLLSSLNTVSAIVLNRATLETVE